MRVDADGKSKSFAELSAPVRCAPTRKKQNTHSHIRAPRGLEGHTPQATMGSTAWHVVWRLGPLGESILQAAAAHAACHA